MTGHLIEGRRYELTCSGPPEATMGAGKAGAGSRLTDTEAGNLYLNKGDIGVPDWREVTTA
jgi:hypothetical protein